MCFLDVVNKCVVMLLTYDHTFGPGGCLSEVLTNDVMLSEYATSSAAPRTENTNEIIQNITLTYAKSTSTLN